MIFNVCHLKILKKNNIEVITNWQTGDRHSLQKTFCFPAKWIEIKYTHMHTDAHTHIHTQLVVSTSNLFSKISEDLLIPDSPTLMVTIRWS